MKRQIPPSGMYLRKNILKDILTAPSFGGTDMLFTEYDEQEHMAFSRKKVWKKA